jgi:hypothetical protein
LHWRRFSPASLAAYAAIEEVAMADTKYLGDAWAWKDGDRWFYVTEPKSAPEGATQCELFELDGEVILHESTSRTGEFIRGAVNARSAQ